MYLGAQTYPGHLTFPGSTVVSGGGGGTTLPPVGTAIAGIFRTPIYQRRYPVIPPLTALINYSKAVLRIGGQWIETEWPTEEQINGSDYYFPGGYDIAVDAATAAVLTAAGYTVTTG